MGSRIIFTACMTILSSSAANPSGRGFPSPFGIWTRRTGGGWYLPLCSRSCKSSNRLRTCRGLGPREGGDVQAHSIGPHPVAFRASGLRRPLRLSPFRGAFSRPVHLSSYASPVRSPSLAQGLDFLGVGSSQGRICMNFVAAFPTAHALACLRFASRISAPVARLTTDSVSSPLLGWDSHLGSCWRRLPSELHRCLTPRPGPFPPSDGSSQPPASSTAFA